MWRILHTLFYYCFKVLANGLFSKKQMMVRLLLNAKVKNTVNGLIIGIGGHLISAVIANSLKVPVRKV